MAGISELKTLAARKQALVAESERYRHALALELQNLHLYRTGVKRKLQLLRFLKPLMVLVPVAGSVFGLRHRSKREEKKPARGLQKWWGVGMVGWRMYQRAAPVIAQFIARRKQRRHLRERHGEMSP